MKAAKRKTLKSKLLLVLLYSVLTAGIFHGFKMITILWSVHIVQESLKMCPGPQTFESNLPSGDEKVLYLAESTHTGNI